MEQQHTQEPWFWSEKYGEICFTSRADDQSHGMSCPVDMADEANARRIVACVNACAGIPTDILEHAADFGAAGIQTIESVRKQRDELLAELEFQRDRNYNPFEPDNQCNNYKRLCAAIASGKGGAA